MTDNELNDDLAKLKQLRNCENIMSIEEKPAKKVKLETDASSTVSGGRYSLRNPKNARNGFAGRQEYK